MSSAFGLGPIKDDDELLDRAGSRQTPSSDGVEALFAAWTASIDADERRSARTVGPLGLRRIDGVDVTPETVPEPRVVRVGRTRAVAVVGVLALTLSGGGVAAALTDADLPVLGAAIQKVTGAPIVMRPAPVDAVPVAATTTTDDAGVDPDSLPQVLAQVEDTIAKGDTEKAQGMIEVIRSVAPKGVAGAEITRKASELEERITSAPVVLAEAPVRTTSAPGPWVRADSPSPAAVSTAAPTGTSAADKPTTGTGAPTDEVTAPTSTTTVPAGTPDPTAIPSPTPTSPAVGTAGGDQVAGTGTPTAEGTPGQSADDKATPTQSWPRSTPTSRVTPAPTGTAGSTGTATSTANSSATPKKTATKSTGTSTPKVNGKTSSAWQRTSPASAPAVDPGSADD